MVIPSQRGLSEIV